MNRFYVELGQNIRRHRQRAEARLSQDTLAKRVGMSRTSITNIEKGRQQLPLHMLYAFADALGVEPVVLLPDKKKLLKDGGRRVTVDLSALPQDVADFVDRVASHRQTK
jgi:transcriptional regulator with XRE-family HTH domain